MPIYEYKCEKCSMRFELKRRFSDNGRVPCLQCGTEAVRIFSPVPIIFKGPGFYVTDSSKDHSQLPAKDDDGSHSDKKSETAKL